MLRIFVEPGKSQLPAGDLRQRASGRLCRWNGPIRPVQKQNVAQILDSGRKLFLLDIAKSIGGTDDRRAHIGICGGMGRMRKDAELAFRPGAGQFPGGHQRRLDIEPSL